MAELDLSLREQQARLLGRKDLLTDLQPLMSEAGELADRYSAEEEPATLEAMFVQQLTRAAELSQLIARIVGFTSSAGQELTGEMRLLGLLKDGQD